MAFKKGETPKGAKVFAKGVSGNPKGRPEGARGKKKILQELMEAVLNEEHIDGKVKEMTVLEMLHVKMIEQVKKHGNVTAYKALLDRYEGAVKPVEDDEDDENEGIVFAFDNGSDPELLNHEPNETKAD